jgi:hypothetical protein
MEANDVNAAEYAANFKATKNFESIADVLMTVDNGIEAALVAVRLYRALPTIELRADFLKELES